MMRILVPAVVTVAACAGKPVQFQDHLETSVKPQIVAGLVDNSKTQKDLEDLLKKEVMIPYQAASAAVDEGCQQPEKELDDSVKKGFELRDSLFKLFGFQFVPSSNLAENEEKRTAAAETLSELFIHGNTEFSELKNHALLRPLVSMLEAEEEKERRRMYGVMNQIMMERDLLGKDHEWHEDYRFLECREVIAKERESMLKFITDSVNPQVSSDLFSGRYSIKTNTRESGEID